MTAEALPVRRSRLVDTPGLRGVVVEIDPTRSPRALAVLQASLHDPPAGRRLIFGYEVTTSGLGGWVGDRRVRIRIWPAFVDAEGEITEEDPSAPDADVLAIDLDPEADAGALADLERTGRLIVAGPDAGPVPLVVDIAPARLRDALDRVDPGS